MAGITEVFISRWKVRNFSTFMLPALCSCLFFIHGGCRLGGLKLIAQNDKIFLRECSNC